METPPKPPKDSSEPLRLEPEDPTPRHKPSPPPDATPDDVPEIEIEVEEESGGGVAAPWRTDEAARREAARAKVSTRTVREREEPETRTQHGTLAPPPGWPREALAYPFRDAAGFAVATAAFVAGDAVEAGNFVLGVVLKIVLVLTLLHWQVRAVARTATGDDRPPWFFDPKTLDLGELVALVALVFYLIPAGVVFVRPYLESPQNPTRTGPQTLALVAFAGAAFLVAPVLLLATALSDRRLMWPWRAVLWVARGLAPCIVVGLGWAALWGVEGIIAARTESGVGATLAVSIPLRVASLAFCLVGARALGVVGRRYEI